MLTSLHQIIRLALLSTYTCINSYYNIKRQHSFLKTIRGHRYFQYKRNNKQGTQLKSFELQNISNLTRLKIKTS